MLRKFSVFLLLSAVSLIASRAQEARTPDAERASFKLPADFTAELVADESVMKKAVSFNFDTAGRMWVTTAGDYPFDGNEQPEKANELYKSRGIDGVIVFETPWESGLQKPRTFAGQGLGDETAILQKLAMPMGALPYKDGAIVQHGSDLLFLRDTDGNGSADKSEVLLTGFGTQDSHLLPHGFTRGPGDWIYFAQGAFNESIVTTKEGNKVHAAYCKMMRMKPDGSQFEVVGWGLNNIWGFVIDPRGQMWVQEANDMGYPIAPFEVGMAYPGIGSDKPKPYAPFMPPLKKRNNCEMGGTGLSGLALNEDPATWPEPWRGAFMVANPITNKLQALRVHPGKPEDGYDGMELEKLPDFLTTEDTFFRPVAIQFGPDGALYVIDWYNKIISHNEVPRVHPERDKVRSRIWRIRWNGAAKREVPNLAKIESAKLVEHLKSPNQWEANSARFELIDRGAKEQEVTLRNALTNSDITLPLEIRVQPLWALEGLNLIQENIRSLTAANEYSQRRLRREIIRIAASVDSSGDALGLLAPLDGYKHPPLQNEFARMVTEHSPEEAVQLLMWLAGERALVTGSGYQDFTRYLIRLGLEKHRSEIAPLLSKVTGWNPEAIAMASLSLPDSDAAPQLLKILPRLNRPLHAAEVGVLANQISQPEVRKAFVGLLSNPETQPHILSVLETAPTNKEGEITTLITDSVRDLVKRKPEHANFSLLVRLARTFRITALEPDIVEWLNQPLSTPDLALGIKTLRNIESNNVALFKKFTAATYEDGLRGEALLSLGGCKTPEALTAIIELWPTLTNNLRKHALERHATTKLQAEALAKAIRENIITGVDREVIVRITKVLGAEHPEAAALAEILKASDPEVVSPEQQKALEEKFVKFRDLANKPGDVAKGKTLVTGLCMGCHMIKDAGGNIGPSLSGAGAMGIEALLRNILTPNAQLESGYYRHDLELNSGDLLSGFLVKQDVGSVTIRQLGSDDRTIPRSEVKTLTVTKRSLMPEGLIDGLPPESVSDLLAYLMTLK